MSTIRSMIAPGRRLLTRHLARLSDTLETFGARLREAVSSAVGDTVAGVVRETIRTLLTEEPPDLATPSRFAQPSHHRGPLWASPDGPEPDPWYDPEDYPPEDDYEDPPPTAPAERAPAPSRLPRAIAAGLNATLRWLRRNVGRFPVLTAFAAGLLTAVATYAGGPLAAAAVGLVGSAFNLLSLAEVIHAGADAMAALGIS